MLKLFGFLLLISLATAARVETHFYSSPSSVCGLTSESSRYFYYDTTTCYVNRTLTGVLTCPAQINCLDQQLEFSSLENCYATAINASLGSFGGSFRIQTNSSGHFREQFASSDCTGNADLIQLKDNCDLNACSGDLSRLQRFPQRLSVITSASAEASDSSDDLGTGGLIGISVLSGVILLGIGALSACVLLVVLLGTLLVIFFGISLFFFITTYIRYRNELKSADEEQGPEPVKENNEKKDEEAEEHSEAASEINQGELSEL